MIHTSNANWPPSRKREEARALENLRKRVEQSKLYKANRVSDPCESTSASLGLTDDQLVQLDNRPKLLKKVSERDPSATWILSKKCCSSFLDATNLDPA